MAKTKTKCLAMQRTDLHATEGQRMDSQPVPPPPAKRVRTKKAAEPPRDEPEPSLPDFELSWSNMKRIMDFYKLSEKDATQLLLQVVGPDPNGASFWSRYADRIKQERADEGERVPKKARVEVPELLPDNQLGDPALKAEYEGSVATLDDPDYVEGEEEESLADDPEQDGDLEAPPAVSRTDDDGGHDSPNSGCASVPKDVPEVVCSTQPEEVPEPTRETVVCDPAAKDAQAAFHRQNAIESIPTPLTKKSTRYLSRATRAEDPDDILTTGMLLV